MAMQSMLSEGTKGTTSFMLKVAKAGPNPHLSSLEAPSEKPTLAITIRQRQQFLFAGFLLRQQLDCLVNGSNRHRRGEAREVAVKLLD